MYVYIYTLCVYIFIIYMLYMYIIFILISYIFIMRFHHSTRSINGLFILLLKRIYVLLQKVQHKNYKLKEQMSMSKKMKNLLPKLMTTIK